MANFNLYGTHLVWPSSQAGENVNHKFQLKKRGLWGKFATVKMNMIVVYGKKGDAPDAFYLFSYTTAPQKAFSPSKPSIIKLSSGISHSSPISGATFSYSAPASEWKNSGNNVDFQLNISVTAKGETKPQTLTFHVTGSIS